MNIAKLTIRIGGHCVTVTDCSTEDPRVRSLLDSATSAHAEITIEVPESPEAAALVGQLVFMRPCEPEVEQVEPLKVDILEQTIEALELDVRIVSHLRAAGIEQVRQLIGKTHNEIHMIRYIGHKAMNKITAALQRHNLVLGQKPVQ